LIPETALLYLQGSTNLTGMVIKLRVASCANNVEMYKPKTMDNSVFIVMT